MKFLDCPTIAIKGIYNQESRAVHIFGVLTRNYNYTVQCKFTPLLCSRIGPIRCNSVVDFIPGAFFPRPNEIQRAFASSCDQG